MNRSDALPPIQRLPSAVLVPFCGLCSTLLSSSPAAAQLVPANDGTNTIVTPATPIDGSGHSPQFDIEQGSLSDDAKTQFHSFESFSIQAEETANFISPAGVQNILTRVSGGGPSVINGQIRVTSSAAPNLFLLNPAGVLFGSKATVNLPANLTITTADAIEFEQGRFSATAPNFYDAISGLPTGQFDFSSRSGGTANAGNLTFAPEASVLFIGRTVENTGTLAAPGGQITLAAVPQSGTVRIGQSDRLLTLEIDDAPSTLIEASAEDGRLTLDPLSLPALLTQPDASTVNYLSVDESGVASLSSQSLSAGSAVVSGTLDASTDRALAEGTGGEINVLGDRVALQNATLSTDSLNAGGTIRIGGDYRGQGPLYTASQTYIDEGTTLSADATDTGDGGNVVVWADDTTQYLGDISATGGAIAGDGGFIEVSGKSSLNFQGSADTRSPHGEIGSLLLDPENITIVNGSLADDDAQISDGTVMATEGTQFALAERTLAALSGNTAVTLEAANNITVQPLADRTLAFRPGTAPVTFRADADGDGVGDFRIQSDHTIITPGRSLSISGANLQLGTLNTAAAIQGGDINLTASGNITVGNLESFAVSSSAAISPKGGDITVMANGDVIAGEVSPQNAVQPGNVTLDSQSGSVSALAVPEASSGSAVILNAPQAISVGGNVIQAVPAPAIAAVPTQLMTAPAIAIPQDTSLESTSLESALSEETPLEGSTTLSAEALQGVLENVTSALSAFSLSAQSSVESASGKARSASSEMVQRTELTDRAVNAILADTETQQTAAFGAYFNRNFETAAVDISAVKQLLTDIERETSNRSAIIYVKAPSADTLEQRKEQLIQSQLNRVEIPLEAPPQLPLGSFELVLITADSTPVSVTIPELENAELLQTVNRFRSDLLTSVRRGGEPYLASAQQLYRWLIAPLEADLEAAGVDTLVFKLDEGLRTLPLAALHNEDRFLIEQYSLGVLPSVGLANTQYEPLNDARVLAMGASEFEQLEPLPAVSQELAEISMQWPTRTFLNQSFTRQNLTQQQARQPADIVHLATHAEFNAGTTDDSYIQLWDERLRLSELDQMNWDRSALSLLVLSACSTAMGNPDAELGFAGVALASGARSVLASLWSVDDVGTLRLMDSFYEQLKTSSVKAEALQAAQLSLLNGASGDIASTPSTEVGTLTAGDFSHPYYWSSFTLIGSPW